MFVLFYYSQITFRRAGLFLGQFSKLFTVYIQRLVSVLAHFTPQCFRPRDGQTTAQRTQAEAPDDTEAALDSVL